MVRISRAHITILPDKRQRKRQRRRGSCLSRFLVWIRGQHFGVGARKKTHVGSSCCAWPRVFRRPPPVVKTPLNKWDDPVPATTPPQPLLLGDPGTLPTRSSHLFGLLWFSTLVRWSCRTDSFFAALLQPRSRSLIGILVGGLQSDPRREGADS